MGGRRDIQVALEAFGRRCTPQDATAALSLSTDRVSFEAVRKSYGTASDAVNVEADVGRRNFVVVSMERRPMAQLTS